jgi:ferredoxin
MAGNNNLPTRINEKGEVITISRDDCFRCKICLELYADADCASDPITGMLICPKGCKEVFNQPPYQSPLISD